MPGAAGNGKGAARPRRVLGLLLLPVVGAVTFLLALEQVYNYDIWWHLRTGDWILEHLAVPRADPFSFTTPGAEWVPHYWLSDVLLALVHGAAGAEGLVLLKAALLASAFGLAYWSLVRRRVEPMLGAFLLLLAAFIARFRFLVRPHIFLFLFAALFLWVLGEARDGRRERLRLLWLLPLMLLWANLHGSFALGIVLAGCLFAEECLHWIRRRLAGRPSPARDLALTGLLVPGLLLVSMVTPFGPGSLRWVVQDFFAKSVSRSFEIEEHIGLAWPDHPLFWALLVATGLSFLPVWRRTRLFHLLVYLATAALAFGSVRYVGVAALLQCPILGCNLHLLRWKLPRVSPRIAPAVGLPLLIATGLLLLAATFTGSKTYRFGVGVNESRYPVEAVRFLERLRVRGNIYNSWRFGGYLLWHLPWKRDFVDGRSLDAQLDFYQRFAGMDAGRIDRLVDELQIEAALVEYGDRTFGAYLRSTDRFQPAFFDDQALVYLRADLPDRPAWAGVRLFRTIRPITFDFSYLGRLAEGPEAAGAEEELRHAVELAPGSFKPRFYLAFFLQRRAEPAEALEQYLAAAGANPRLAYIHYGVGKRAGRLALSLGRWAEAARVLEAALRYAPAAELRFLLGTALQKQGDLEGAERAYRAVLDEDPAQVPTLTNLGFLLLDGNRFSAAEESFSAALGVDPLHEAAHYGLALTAERRGDLASAKRRWRNFLRRFPESSLAPQAEQRLRRLVQPAPPA